MNGTDSKASIGSLILIPAVITLAITILRLVGELQGWSPLFFNKAAGGGGAIVGISWLPIIFGPYFAMKLAGAGEGPTSSGKAIGMCIVGLLVFIAGVAVFFMGVKKQMAALFIVGFAIELAAAFVPRVGWRSLGNTLLAYAFAARIPVVIVMFIAMSANGGQGWGTHYDVAAPGFIVTSFAQKFIDLAVLPQLTGWIAWTAILGGLFGAICAAVFGRRKATQPAS
jgi:hypothetical protein